ncbi:MAG: bifunctional UDP-N-acetylmuramoyl-tripeptide:D-alanyl-D-alanine ligase/alanine racemase [Bacteroidetes bacterium]|nr:MAG: bifunctional UDP-N-acetylmuramoyl-tripeptide:D-alanyl-D-alanine ligase/alanine racemase [Bacteroidota bacterium]
MLTVQQIIKITNASVLHIFSDDDVIHFLVTDSRKITSGSNSLFFAIKGIRHDGHVFIDELYKKGTRNFIIELDIDIKKYPNASFFKVVSAIEALQKIAAFKRNQFDKLPVLAITGSNAKTIIKEWISQMLNPEYAVVKNPKSYNSQIGVPLSVWQINEKHTFGVFEAGISKPNEMPILENIIKETRQQKINEKLSLFEHTKCVFYCADHLDIDFAVKNNQLTSFSWSKENKEADVNFSILTISESSVKVQMLTHVESHKVSSELDLPFTDLASLENLFHCISFLYYVGFDVDSIQRKLQLIKPVSMRLELKQAKKGCYIIDDTYNNDLAGLTIALDFIAHQHQKQKKSVILSDLLETGLDSDVLYMVIAETLSKKGITKLIGIGKNFVSHSHYFNTIDSVSFFDSTSDFINSEALEKFSDEIVLIKGARIFEFEKIVKRMEQKSHRTVLEINLDALSHNLNFYKSKLLPTTKIMVMVKSFAYGAGSLEVANLLQFHRVDYLAVAYTDEAVELRQAGIVLPIMIMNTTEEDFEFLAKNKLEPVIYSIDLLKKLIYYLEYNYENLPIHIELETGMNRLGIAEAELPEAIDMILKSDKISVSSVFSHLAGADDAQFEDYTLKQYGILMRCTAYIENKLKYKFLRHILNSAGIVRYPDLHLDMVRLGIGLYGIEANGQEQNALMNVSTLKTTISQIKKIKKGESIGYSRKGKISKESTIGTIAIGYGDGYSRSFSNGIGKVLINNKLAPVIGNVCMDMTMIDLTEIEAKEGDEVIVFGKGLNTTEIAKLINTIPYELFTGISERVKRVFFAE